MDINILIICITVIIVAAFAAGTAAYVADRKRTRAQAFAEAMGHFFIGVANDVRKEEVNENE